MEIGLNFSRWRHNALDKVQCGCSKLKNFCFSSFFLGALRFPFSSNQATSFLNTLATIHSVLGMGIVCILRKKPVVCFLHTSRMSILLVWQNGLGIPCTWSQHGAYMHRKKRHTCRRYCLLNPAVDPQYWLRL